MLQTAKYVSDDSFLRAKAGRSVERAGPVEVWIGLDWTRFVLVAVVYTTR